MSGRPFVVALTGGVASGKTTVADLFARLGVPVLDADVAARQVLEPGSDGLRAVVEAFGPEVLKSDGNLDRRGLRHKVFADDAARKQLETIVHPRVRARLRTGLAEISAPWALLVVPLLSENQADYRWVDRVLVVDVPKEVQIARLMQRDGIEKKLASQMLAAQATRDQRLALADDVIDNRGDPATLEGRVRELAMRYASLAEADAERDV